MKIMLTRCYSRVAALDLQSNATWLGICNPRRTTKQIFGIALILTLLASFSSCAQPKGLVYQDVQNFRVHSVNLQQAVFAMDLRFYNPNKFGLSVKDADVDAYINNKYLGKALMKENIQVPARDTFALPMTFQIGLSDLLSQGMSMLGSMNEEVLVRMQGSVRAGKAGIFVPVPILYEGKQMLKL